MSRYSLLSETKIRLYLIDGSFLEIRYPLENEYSLHWHRRQEIIRLNTAPYHPEIKTFPRHIHKGLRIEEDQLTDFGKTPEENVRGFLSFVREEIRRYPQK